MIGKMSALLITIDGPAASGKSSVARLVADRLNIPFVSSGLLYRAATLLVLERRINAQDEAAVLSCLAEHDVRLEALPTEPNRVHIDARDMSAALHTDDVDAGVSAVAAHPRLRGWVLEQLRAVPPPFVVEGRDMGTAVFPQATHKFYLNAAPEVRARRRVGERHAGLSEVTEAIARRDRLDAKQSAPAPDAAQIDTSALTLEQVVAEVLGRVQETRVRP